MATDRKHLIMETLRERVKEMIAKKEKPAVYRRNSENEGETKKDSSGNTIFVKWNNEDFYNDFSEKYNYKYDTVKGWFTKTMPGYPEIIDIAEYFSVSVDYLIGKTDIESTITADFASVYTGLNINAINLLHEYYKTGHEWQLNTIDAINFLLERKETASILTNMYYFFFGNYINTRNGEDSFSLVDKNGYGVDFYIPIVQQSLFMSTVTNNLTKAYERYVKDNPQYKDYGKPTKENRVMRCVDGRLGTKLERLNSVRDEIKQELKKHENQLDKFKKTNCNDMIELCNSLVKYDTECLEIVERMIKEL